MSADSSENSAMDLELPLPEPELLLLLPDLELPATGSV
jgi:hypothetical protein